MKSMLLTATAVGAAIAGLILYYQRKDKSSTKVPGAGRDSGIGQLERPAHHAMG